MIRRGGGLSTQAALLAVTAVLCTVGLVMVWSASSVVAVSLYGSSWILVRNEIAFMVAGTVVLLGLRAVGYATLGKLARPIVVVGMAGLVAVEVIGFSTMGSARWIRLPMGLTIQPSELMKFALVVFVAERVATGMARGASWKDIAKQPATWTCVAAGFVILQPDMGTAVVLVTITLGILTVAGLPKRTLAATLVAIGALGLFAAVAMPYRMARLTSFLNRSATDQAGGYQVTQSLVGYGSGGLTGSGLGNSKEKWGLLPNPHTDFIFSILGEELGFIGTMVVIACFVALVVIGWRIARNASDLLGKFMAIGITIWLGVEAIINIAASVGLLPVTGIPLPFISFGGTALVCSLGAIGVLADIARHEAHIKPAARRPRSTASSSSSSGSSRPKGSRRAPAARRPGGATARPASRRQANGGR